MNMSTMLSMLKMIDEVMKLLNDIEIHTYIYYHYTYNIHSQSIILRLMVVSLKAKKKQHACVSSGLRDHYSE